MSYFANFSRLVAYAMLPTVLATALVAQERVSLLSCKFGPDCVIGAPECSDYTHWYIIRNYPAEKRYTVFDALGSRETDFEFKQMEHMMVLTKLDELDKLPERGSSNSLETVSISSLLEASINYSFNIEFEIGDWRFYSGTHKGMCKEIT